MDIPTQDLDEIRTESSPLPCRVARPKEYMGQLQTPWHGRVFNRKKWDFNSQMSDINNE